MRWKNALLYICVHNTSFVASCLTKLRTRAPSPTPLYSLLESIVHLLSLSYGPTALPAVAQSVSDGRSIGKDLKRNISRGIGICLEGLRKILKSHKIACVGRDSNRTLALGVKAPQTQLTSTFQSCSYFEHVNIRYMQAYYIC
jgi:hypothetical protein